MSERTSKYIETPKSDWAKAIRARPRCVHGHLWTDATRYVNKTTGALCCRHCRAISAHRCRKGERKTHRSGKWKIKFQS